MRTFVAVDDTALAATHPNATDAREIWGYYPDDSPLKGLHAGDTRAALAPFLAHQVWTWYQTISNHVILPTSPDALIVTVATTSRCKALLTHGGVE